MCQEPEELIVRRLVQRPQGGSGNNPFLSSNRHAMEYTVLIDPQALAKKIMTVSPNSTTTICTHVYILYVLCMHCYADILQSLYLAEFCVRAACVSHKSML
jgi:hypothetical protein